LADEPDESAEAVAHPSPLATAVPKPTAIVTPATRRTYIEFRKMPANPRLSTI
jgi:hypothetical protein